MSQLIIPENYKSALSPLETQRGIKKIKDYFQQELAYGLSLRRVSAPLFVQPETGLNDNLNGVERRVSFTLKDMDEAEVEVVQSLAKWKRNALGKYGIKPGNGIYTDMGYPPFTDLIVAEFTSETEETALEQADRCREYLINAGLPEADKIFRPRISQSFKGQESFRYHILVKCPKGERNRYVYYLRYFADQMMAARTDCNLTIDVNPYSTF